MEVLPLSFLVRNDVEPFCVKTAAKIERPIYDRCLHTDEKNGDSTRSVLGFSSASVTYAKGLDVGQLPLVV